MRESKVASRLWDKGLPLDSFVHRFTVGDDPDLDRILLRFDIVGTAAHVQGLAQACLLPIGEAQSALDVLAALAIEARAGRLTIRPEQEDAHTALEMWLVERAGQTGKRIHLGRSRNDQVILALRLYMRDAVLGVMEQVADLASGFLAFANTHADCPLPGYTHLRRAMPSTFGLWAAGFAAGLAEETEALASVYQRLDRSPLGAAAGFGVPLPIDRAYTARRLGFSRVQVSPADVMNSRGRHELALVNELVSVATILEKFLWDVALYSTVEFSFLRLPDAFTTGSSIMPQKRNPDVIELARARCRELRGYALMFQEMVGGLPSGYHRDVQLLKKPLFTTVEGVQTLLSLLCHLLPRLEVDADGARAACTPDLHAAHHASALARRGVPFRDAYRQVADALEQGTFQPLVESGDDMTLGGKGRLGLDQVTTAIEQHRHWVKRKRDHIERHERDLWTLPE